MTKTARLLYRIEMSVNNSNPNTKNSKPLKKRKIDINKVLTDDISSSIQLSQQIDTNMKCIDKENERIFTQNICIKQSPRKDNNDEYSVTNNSKQILKNDNSLPESRDKEYSCVVGNDYAQLTNNCQDSIIIRKIDDLCTTPTKNNSDELIDTKNIKIENIKSPQIFSPDVLNTNSIEWHSKDIKNLLETPLSYKKSKHYDENSTPNLRKKRKIGSDIDDYDELSDELKSELYDPALNDMEPIAMLHDLHSLMDFEDTKIATEFLSSTANDIAQDEHNMELSKDPQTDPLFIASDNECDMSIKNVENKQHRKVPETKLNFKQSKKKHQNVKKHTKSKNKSTIKFESSNENGNDTYDIIKNILGELDIQSETENEILNSESTEKELYNLKVKIMHTIPPQHKIEHTAGSRPLTKTEKQLFLKYGPIKKGVFLLSEDEIIMDNWEKFCEVHNWNHKNTSPFCSMKNGNKFYIKSMEERQKFVQFLANGLPWRSLYSVYQRFRRLYTNYETSFKRYTSLEDRQILSYMQKKYKEQKKSNHLSKLSKILGRSNHSIWLRYQLLKKMQENQKGKPLTKVEWTLPLIGQFLKIFMNVALCDNVRDLKDAIIPKTVWLKVEEKLQISHNTLKIFWMHQLHMQLFCPEAIYLNDIKIKLIEYIYGKGISNTREIIWPNIARYFEGITTVFLCKTFFYLVQEAIIKINSKHFPDIVEYLYHEKIKDIQNELTDKFLPRLSYDNGKISIIDKDTSDSGTKYDCRR